MNLLPLGCALVALGLVLPAPSAQEPGRKPPGPAPTTGEKPTGEQIALLSKQIQGLWSLQRYDSNMLRRERREEVGYLLATDQYLSFECHVGWLDDRGQREFSLFFTGTHRYQIQLDGTLVLTGLIGTQTDPGGQPHFEPPGITREYRLEIQGGDVMTLVRRSDNARFTLQRFGTEVGLDFYGRRKPKEPKEPEKKPGGG
jgi:hypothetical protein